MEVILRMHISIIGDLIEPVFTFSYMNKPKISVVTVCYNAVKTIEKAILSVINQTYDNTKYIIVEGLVLMMLWKIRLSDMGCNYCF